VNLRTILLLAPLALTLIAGCGGGDDDEKSFTLETGYYAVSNVAVVGDDGCELLGEWGARGEIYIAAAGGVASFDLDASPGISDPDVMPQATINGDAVDSIAMYRFPHAIFFAGEPCYMYVVRSMSGELVGDGTAALRFTQTMTGRAEALACDKTIYLPSCTTELTFVATRTGP
jgi:hypothetical protein